MSQPRLITHLAAVCREARENADLDLLDVQFAFDRPNRPKTIKTIERFEVGDTWPNDPQVTVSAYADATNTPAAKLWQRAIKKWEAAQAKASADPPQQEQDTPDVGSNLRRSSAQAPSEQSGESRRPRQKGGR